MGYLELISSIVLVIIGWLLALLTQPISEKIKWAFGGKKEVLRAIKLELKEMQIKFVWFSLTITEKFFVELLTDDYLKNIKSYLTNIDSSNVSDDHKELYKTVLEIPAEKYREIFTHINEKSKSNALTLKKVKFNLLSSRIDLLSRFDTKLKSHFVELLYQINGFNENVDLYYFFYKETFNSALSESNRRIIKENMLDSFLITKKTSDLMITKIDKTLKSIDGVL